MTAIGKTPRHRTQAGTSWEIGGFVFQILEPKEHAGKVLTAHFDGPLASGDPFKAFAPGRRYKMDVPAKWIGDTSFGLCY